MKFKKVFKKVFVIKFFLIFKPKKKKKSLKKVFVLQVLCKRGRGAVRVLQANLSKEGAEAIGKTWGLLVRTNM